MTQYELLNNEVFREAAVALNDYQLNHAKFREHTYCYYKQRIFNNTSTKLFSITGYRDNIITIYDYTSLTQQEIHSLIDAKLNTTHSRASTTI